MNRLLAIAAVGEVTMGLALVAAPSLVGRLLLGAELGGVAIPLARVTGIALIGLGVACLPGMALAGMTTYSTAVAVYLLYVGIRGQWIGPLLWPAVVLHAVLSLLLIRLWAGGSRSDREMR